MLARNQLAGTSEYTQVCAPDPSDRNMSHLRIGSLCLDVRLVSQMLRP